MESPVTDKDTPCRTSCPGLVGRNLFDGHFYEFGNDGFMGTMATEVQPEIYGQVVWRH